MSAKSMIRAVTPPVIWDTAHDLKLRFSPPATPVEEISFPSWESACEAVSNYADHSLTAFRAARSRNNIEQKLFPSAESHPVFLLTNIIGSGLAVTDFGGAFGEKGMGLCQSVSSISYTIVEQAAVIEVAQPTAGIIFANEIPRMCDVFFTSGTLQYLADPYAAVEAGFKSAKKAAVLARNCFSQQVQFRVQKSRLFDNGTGAIPDGFEDRDVFYPIRSIDEDRINAIATGCGFRRIARLPEPLAAPSLPTSSALLMFLKD